VRQHIARVVGASRIDRGVAFVNVADDPVLVDHKRRAIAEALRFIENAIILHDRSFEIAE
jgi:hypothetical protein